MAGQRLLEEIWLLGQPKLRDYLSFVRHSVKDGATIDPARLTDEWRSANDHYQSLEDSETGIADKVECHDLPRSLVPLARRVKESASFTRTFDALPTTFAMVELDRMVVFQKSVTKTFVSDLEARIGPRPDPERVFGICHPLGERDAPVQVERTGSRRYVFRCESTDFRFHETVLLKPGQLQDYASFGPMTGVVGVVVGFGSNFLNAIRVGKRLVLHNGYHRAMALRGLGVTHAPCIIQEVTRGDELELATSGPIAEDPEFYFQSARPPLLKDFFDPAIRRVWPVLRQARWVEVSFEVREMFVPEGMPA